ncbi:OsmC family protein [Conyzicola nivalis]|uniref:Peroxiredoxin n=1 Tax=Conyzicola nivalis TaxID=1477021 RepID=A0A916SCA2_9MICO|nr:OsmC family peroxiredoxin [Conyzicola nivalis]GGA90983.1 peroxiredoxin [Conyzicola nivalis]
MKAIGKSSWQGSWKTGNGTISTDTPAVQGLAYSYETRFVEESGASPEELLAAAHASCFNQALANNFDMVGLQAEDISTSVAVDFGISDAGLPTIYGSHITVEARVPGIDAATFADRAQRAADGCTISRIMNCEITLEAKLLGPADGADAETVSA